MSKKVEKELKFRLTSSPHINGVLEMTQSTLIEQTYLIYDQSAVRLTIEAFFPKDRLDWATLKEVRLRRKCLSKADNSQYFLTLKSDGSLERDEYETMISETDYETLMKNPNWGQITKWRTPRQLPNTDLIIE